MKISFTNQAITVFLYLICGFFAGNSHSAGLTRIGAQNSLFRETTWDWGLVAQHQQRRDHLTGLTDTLGAGACVLDVDNDGWLDGSSSPRCMLSLSEAGNWGGATP